MGPESERDRDEGSGGQDDAAKSQGCGAPGLWRGKRQVLPWALQKGPALPTLDLS